MILYLIFKHKTSSFLGKFFLHSQAYEYISLYFSKNILNILLLFILLIFINVNSYIFSIISNFFSPHIKHSLDLFSLKQNKGLLLNIENN